MRAFRGAFRRGPSRRRRPGQRELNERIPHSSAETIGRPTSKRPIKLPTTSVADSGPTRPKPRIQDAAHREVLVVGHDHLSRLRGGRANVIIRGLGGADVKACSASG
jgi:hypothetical protein